MEDRQSTLPERMSVLFDRPRKWRRAMGRIAAALGISVVFTTSLAVGVIAHLDTRAMRVVARQVATWGLGKLFRGRIIVGEIEALSLRGATIRSATITDPWGRPVIEAQGIVARLSTFRLIRSLISDDQALTIIIPSVQIASGTVTLIEGSDGVVPTIAETFEMRSTSPPSPTDPNALAPYLSIPNIAISSVKVVGNVARPLDGDIVRLKGSVMFASDIVSVDVEPTSLVERSYLFGEANGIASYHLRVDTNTERVRKSLVTLENGQRKPKDEVVMWMDFLGTVGGIQTSATAMLEGDHLRGRAELPEVAPKATDMLFPGFPLHKPLSGLVKIEGDLPTLSVSADFEIAQGRGGIGIVRAEGELRATDDLRYELDVVTSEVDPRAFAPTLPDTRVTANATLRGSFPVNEDPALEIVASAQATTVTLTQGGAPIVVPGLDAYAQLVRGELIGSATVHEPGVDADLRFQVRAGGAVHFGLMAEANSLGNIPRLSSAIQGNASVEVTGSYVNGVLLADIHGNGARLAGFGADAERGFVRSKLRLDDSGAFIEGEVGVDDSNFLHEHVDKARLTFSGPLLKPRVGLKVIDSDLGTIEGSASMDLVARSASSVVASLDRGGVKAEARAQVVRVGPNGVDLSSVVVKGEGLGVLSGNLRTQGGEILGTLKAEDIDLEKLGRLLNLPVPIGGVANADIDVRKTREGRQGKIEVEVEGGTVSVVDGVSARLSAKFDGAQVETSGYVRLVATATDEARKKAESEGLLSLARLCDGTIAEVRVSNGKGSLDGPLLSLDTYRRAYGSVDVAAENWNLRCLVEAVPFASLVGEASGLVTTRFRVSREEGAAFPSLEDVYLRTHGLEIAGAPKTVLSGFFGDAEEATDAPPWESRRIDGQFKGDLDGTNGRLEGNLLLFDGTILGEAVIGSTIDLAGLFSRGFATLADAPVDLRLAVPRRKLAELDTLPSFLRDAIPPMGGDLRLEAEMSGTFRAPSFKAHFQGFDVSAKNADVAAWAPPFDVDFTGTYEAETGRVVLDTEVSVANATVATLHGGVRVAWADILKPPEGTIPWTGGAFITLYSFPLESLPGLNERDVAGRITGTVALSDLNVAPKLDVKLLSSAIKLGSLEFDTRIEAHVAPKDTEGTAPVDAGAIDAANTDARGMGEGTLEIDLTDPDGGVLQVVSYAGVLWKGLAIPILDTDRPGGLAMSAKAFRIAAAYPLVADVLSRLDGTVDGSGRVVWGRVADTTKGRFEGQLELKDAIVFIPQFGQELRNGKAKIVAVIGSDTQGGEIRIEDVEAGGVTGRVRGKAVARFDGLSFKTAEAEIVIAKGEEVPITVEGVPIGRAWGTVKVNAKGEDRLITADLRLPGPDLELPTSSSRDVQALDDVPTIHVAQALGPEKQKRSPDALGYVLRVPECNDTRIHGEALELFIRCSTEAPPTIRITDEVRMSGDIYIDKGKLELRRKTFEIERGFVRLREEEPGNPYVNVTAHWDAPDGSRIYVDYVGNLNPLTEEKLRFRSDPPRPRQAIIEALVFGTDLDGAQGSALTTSTASDIAADIGNTALAQVVRGITGIDAVSLSVDTNATGGFRGRVDWRADDNISFGLSSEVVEVGDGTGVKQGNRTELSVDWKFAKNWSLRGSGSAGDSPVSVGLDVIWQYRY